MSAPAPSGLKTEEFNDEIRPQDDLYRHVNGDWIARTDIPDDKARWGSFNELAEQAEKHVHEIIEEVVTAEPGTDARKAGDIYASFMDTDAIAARGTAPLQPLLDRVNAITDVPTLLTVLGEFDREGIASIIGMFVEPDPGNPERYVPFLLQGGITLPDESYFRLDNFATVREQYVAHIETMLTLAGVENAAEQSQRIFELEKELASHHWDNVRSRDSVATYNLRTWAEMQEAMGVDMTPWREAVTPNAPTALDEVVLYQPSYFEGLGTMLTPERVADFVSWLRFKVVHAAAPYLTDELVDANFAFYGTALTGVPVIRERWKRGVSLTEGAMGEAIGKVYVDRHFPPAAKDAMDDLVANVVEAYRQSIVTLDWMGDETRERALDKLSKFTPKIGYPVKWRDYSTLDISADDLLGNVRATNVHEHDRQFARVGEPIDRDEWLMTPQTVNAYYNPLMNEIVFPAAILQYPFFDADRDAAANYGGIAAVIGHEIGHGFDDQGATFNGDGKLEDWWTEADKKAFEERTASLIAQYDALVPVGLDASHTVNGALTIGENIGDLGGLGIALKAYELSLAGAEAPVIDGYTGVQRLLLSWAQVWQQKSREAETIRLLTIDPHSPAEFRCNQIVRNIDAFYEAFNVTESDDLWLDADQRVTIW